MNNDKFIVEQKISNAPWDPTIERHIQVFLPIPDALTETLDLRYFTRYMDGEENVSYRYNQQQQQPWITSNNDRIMRRDLENNFAPIPNPDYDPESEFPQEQFLTEPGFNYLKELAELLPLPTLLRLYILDEDSDPNGRFSK